MIDAKPIGVVAGKVMDDAEAFITEELSDDAEAYIISSLVVAEISWVDSEGVGQSTIIARATDDRNVIAAGLTARTQAALMRQ